MKIVIVENRTLPVNEQLFAEIFNEFSVLFMTISALTNGKQSTSNYYDVLKQKGGNIYLKKMKRNGTMSAFKKIYLPNFITAESDKVLSRRMTNEQLTQKYEEMEEEEKEMLLSFYFQNKALSKEHIASDSGFFMPIDDETGLKNIISIAIPENADVSSMKNYLQTTIRHELQHFTSHHYAMLLGAKGWIGMPTKQAIKGTPKEKTKHQDLPYEFTTDIQDEIDWFMNFLKEKKNRKILLNPKELRKEIFNFVGIGDIEVSSEIFRHYYKTNKRLWRWATNKLLGAVATI